MEESITLAVNRRVRASEKMLKGVMIAMTVLFLLGGIALTRGLMLPCFLTAIAYFLYSRASKKQWEYQLEEGHLRILRVSDSGRVLLHDVPLSDIVLLCRPDDPAAAPYRKGQPQAPKKYDYTSYEENVPYYTCIAKEDGEKEKLLLDLTEEALSMIRRHNPAAVRV